MRKFITRQDAHYPNDQELQINYGSIRDILNAKGEYNPNKDDFFQAVNYLYSRYFGHGDTFFAVRNIAENGHFPVVDKKIQFALPSLDALIHPRPSEDNASQPGPSTTTTTTTTTTTSTEVEEDKININRVTYFVDYHYIQYLLAGYLLKCLLDDTLNKSLKAIASPKKYFNWDVTETDKEGLERLERIISQFNTVQLKSNRSVFWEIYRVYHDQVNPQKFFGGISGTTLLDIANVGFIGTTTFELANPSLIALSVYAWWGLLLLYLNNLNSYINRNGLHFRTFLKHFFDKSNWRESLAFVGLPVLLFVVTVVLGIQSITSEKEICEKICDAFKNQTEKNFNTTALEQACEEELCDDRACKELCEDVSSTTFNEFQGDCHPNDISYSGLIFNIVLILGTFASTLAKLFYNRGISIADFKEINREDIRAAEEILDNNARREDLLLDHQPQQTTTTKIDISIGVGRALPESVIGNEDIENRVAPEQTKSYFLLYSEEVPHWKLYRRKNNSFMPIEINEVTELENFLKDKGINEEGALTKGENELRQLISQYEYELKKNYYKAQLGYLDECSDLLSAIYTLEQEFLFDLNKDVCELNNSLDQLRERLLNICPLEQRSQINNLFRLFKETDDSNFEVPFRNQAVENQINRLNQRIFSACQHFDLETDEELNQDIKTIIREFINSFQEFNNLKKLAEENFKQLCLKIGGLIEVNQENDQKLKKLAAFKKTNPELDDADPNLRMESYVAFIKEVHNQKSDYNAGKTRTLNSVNNLENEIASFEETTNSIQEHLNSFGTRIDDVERAVERIEERSTVIQQNTSSTLRY